MALLRQRNILLISPQSWHKVKVSKHHYASALANLGNQVYFLNPPDDNQADVSVEQLENGVNVVSYNPFFNLALRFRFGPLYRKLMQRQVQILMKKLGIAFDIVWCFDPNLYPDLSAFGARVKIFHPVDVFQNDNAKRVAKSADILFSVSPSILSFFEGLNKPMYFINHGLGSAFSCLAEMRSENTGSLDHLCYVGNLLIPYMDRKLLREVIVSFPEKKFHFIGPFEAAQSSLGGGDEEAEQFVFFLRSCPNVILYGPKGTEEMIAIMKEMDAFLLCYTGEKDGYDLSNSHKILEYLSTGKPLISTPIQAYTNVGELIYSPVGLESSYYEVFFKQVIRNTAENEDPSLSAKRKILALENTYLQQISRIESRLKEHQLI